MRLRGMVQICLETPSGAIAPLAASRDSTLVRLVARQILDDLRRLKGKSGKDSLMDGLNDEQRQHVEEVLHHVGIEL